MLPSQTSVPVRDRQAVLKLVFDVFVKLYSAVPHLEGGRLAAIHALEQEEEGYKKAGGKSGYKNVSLTFRFETTRHRFGMYAVLIHRE